MNKVERLEVPHKEPPAARHTWDAIPVARMAGTEFPDGNDRTLRRCTRCGMLKVTVHAAGNSHAWREWRTKDGQVWHGHTPPCLAVIKEE